MQRSTLPGLVLALAGSAALAGCTGDPSPNPGSTGSPDPQASASPTAPRAPAPPRPDAASCYRLSYDDAVAPAVEAEPVGCRQRHTARTFHVGTLDLVTGGHLLAVDSPRAVNQADTTCARLFARHVGGTQDARRLSMLAVSWFRPTLEQADAGQAWFRCDVIATAAPRRLAALEGRLEGVLATAAGRDRWGRCATARPGTEGATHVLCTRRDARWQAVSTVAVPAGAQGRYPGAAAARRAGAVCEDRARRLADDPLTFTWGYDAPTREQWRGGRHYGFCWVPKG